MNDASPIVILFIFDNVQYQGVSYGTKNEGSCDMGAGWGSQCAFWIVCGDEKGCPVGEKDSRGKAGLWMRGGSGFPGRGSGGKESRSHKGGTAGTDSHMSQISRRGVGVGSSRSRAVGSRFGAPFWLLLLGALVPALSRVPPRPLLAFAPGRQKMPLDHVALDPCQMPTDCFPESESLPSTPQGEISSTEPSFGGEEKRHTEIRRSGMR